MPLLDHFHPPIRDRYPWDSLHAGWATRIADGLNDRWLPEHFVAAELTQAGGKLEIDVATYEAPSEAAPFSGPTLVAAPRLWSPPNTFRTIPAVFPDAFEVRVYETEGGFKLVGVIELVSPSNKDRPEERRAF